jgi:hypothetical protein
VTYPGPGGQWQPHDPNQQAPGSGPLPAQPGYPQQGAPQQGLPQQGHPQQGYPQGVPQQGYPQTGPQGTHGYPQTGPQGFPQSGPQGFPQNGPQGFPQSGPQGTQGFPQSGFPQTGPEGFQQPQFGQPNYGGLGGYGEPAPKKRGKGPIIGAIAAVVVVAVGIAATVFVLNQSSGQKGGEDNPTQAATNLVNSLSQGDVLGVLESLTPAESELLVDFNSKTTQRLKELKVYDEDADPNQLHGAAVEATNLKYDEKGAEKVNDHLTITKLIGGTVSFHADVNELPLTDEFMEAAFPDGVNTEPTDEKVDIAEVVEESGEPIRIATVKVDDKWYPSLFYTVADYALQEAGEEWPAEPIADNGAGSPDDAVKEMVQAAVNADIERVIELLPPDEMGALHDAGPVLVEQAGRPSPAPVEITKLETESTDAESGGKKVMLKEIEVEADGETYRVVKDGDCYTAEGEGETNRLCADDMAAEIGGTSMDPDMKQALAHLASGMIKNTGVVTTEVDGKWYVSPLRTYSELGLTALSDLTPEDVIALMKAS